MASKTFFLQALAGLAAASPWAAPEPAPNYPPSGCDNPAQVCQQIQQYASGFPTQSAFASSFCSSWLHISTLTVSATATSTVSITSTVKAATTITTTSTPTVYTSTQTCFQSTASANHKRSAPCPPSGPQQGSPQGPQQGSPQGPQQGSPQGPQQGSPQGPQQGSPQGPPQGSPQGPQQGSPQGPQQGSPQGPQQGSPQGPQQGSPQGGGGGNSNSGISSACSCFGVNLAPKTTQTTTQTITSVGGTTTVFTSTSTSTVTAAAVTTVNTTYVPTTGTYTASDGSTYIEYNNYDFYGNDIAQGYCPSTGGAINTTYHGNFSCSGFDDCQNVCSEYNVAYQSQGQQNSNDLPCAGITYHDSGYCYLKSAVPGNGAPNCSPQADSDDESAILVKQS